MTKQIAVTQPLTEQFLQLLDRQCGPDCSKLYKLYGIHRVDVH